MLNEIMVAIATLLVATACTTTAKVAPLSEVAQTKADQSGAIFSFQFSDHHSFIGTSGCSVAVSRVDKTLQILQEIHFVPGKEVFLAELEPGSYGYRELRCGAYTADLSFSKLPNFRVYEGKFSVLGTFHISLNQQNYLRYGIRNYNQKTSSSIMKDLHLNAVSTNKLVSGYSGESLR